MRWTLRWPPSHIKDMDKGARPQFLRRIDSTRNMARFYVLILQPTLFGETTLVRQWGRIGTRGREKREHFRDDAEAVCAAARHALRKMRRGYVVT
jgi:predicted DNA-binding WGR domain protein